MEYRPLGRTGLKVSPLCIGTVKFGNPTPDDECARILNTALDAGVNFLDTAHAYGRSEETIGKALDESGRRGEMVICTKVQPMANDRSTILRQAETSLHRLRTDYIDLLLLHRPNPDIPIDESLRALDDLVRSGKVRYIGTSGFKAWQIMEALWCSRELGLSRFVCESSVYNLLCRRPEDELLPMLRTYGVGMTAWSPLGAGVLTDRYSRRNPPDHVDLSETEWQVLETVQELAREKGCTASQFALAWPAAQPGVTSSIAGPRTIHQLHDNLGALNVAFSENELARLDEVAPPGWCARRNWIGARFGQPHMHRW
jgi:aryl-alcohol dehydrogenase-like predicted oxidoreductase